MTHIASIDGEMVEAEDFIKYLKLTDKYDTLIEEFLLRRVAIANAPAEDAVATDEQVQDTADKLRRVLGLHKAKEMLDYLDQQSLEVADFEEFVRGVATIRNLDAKLANNEQIDAYYAKHEPSYRQADISIIVLHKNDEAIANEIAMTVRDIPEDFMALAIEHSLDDDGAKNGGRMGFINHNELNDSLANAVFAAESGDVIGPVPDADGEFLQIVMVHEIKASSDDEDTRRKIAKVLYEEWLEKISSNIDIKVL